MLVTDANLELNAANWSTNISSDVNPVPSDVFQASSLSDGRLLVINTGRQAFAGGLVSCKRPVPQFVGSWPVKPPPVAYAKLSTNITIPLMAARNLARLETDLMVVFTAATGGVSIANRANGSTQWNGDTGNFEIDASSGDPKWSDIGSGPGPITPEEEHALVIYRSFDIANAKSSTIYISWDGVRYPVPAALQNVGFQTSNWGMVASVQKQSELRSPGTTAAIYRATTIEWSDLPF